MNSRDFIQSSQKNGFRWIGLFLGVCFNALNITKNVIVLTTIECFKNFFYDNNSQKVYESYMTIRMIFLVCIMSLSNPCHRQ